MPDIRGSDIVNIDVTVLRFLAVSTAFAVICSVQFAAAGSQAQRPLTVSAVPSRLQPGIVARVAVTGADRDARITGNLLRQDLTFHWDESSQQWRALAGIDLETKPGSYRVRIANDGKDAASRMLRVETRQFSVRRLRVPGSFVDPPADALEQIAADREALAHAYARDTSRQWSGPFVLPVDGRPSSNFGTRSIYNGQPRAPHAGVDFVGAPGTPIRAGNHGHVVIAAPMYFTGNTIVIDYGDRLFSVFAHMSELRAKAGDTVEPATIVGLVGATGRVTGPHLHWSVRLNGARVDPLSLIAATTDDQR